MKLNGFRTPQFKIEFDKNYSRLNNEKSVRS